MSLAIEDWSMEDLQEQAAKLGIPGYEDMDREDLVRELEEILDETN